MIQINNYEDCCGCTACSSVCNHDAITMKADGLGFFYPDIDADKCTDCGLCDRVCAFHANYDTSDNVPQPRTYVSRLSNIKDVIESQSGGLFFAMAKHIIEEGGVVYGVGLDENFMAVHKRVCSIADLDDLRGSKYVQSDLQDTFLKVRQDLRDGRKVLFSGTACQTAGLHSFIGKRYRDGLLLVDLVCHGVPSPYIWRDYVAFVSRKLNRKIHKVAFRDKKHYGWHSHKETFYHDEGFTTYDHYTYLFYENIMLRPSCRICHYTNLRRPSDITICDAWRARPEERPDYDDNKGHSLVMCNTEKGQDFFDSVNSVDKITVNIDEYLQPNHQAPSKFSADSDRFAQLYVKHGFEYVFYRYANIGWRYKMKITAQTIKYYYSAIIKRLR